MLITCNEFTKKYPKVNRIEAGKRQNFLTSFCLTFANGLSYMHNLHTAHGDLKGVRTPDGCAFPFYSLTVKANILINNSRRACIADFGLTIITSSGDEPASDPTSVTNERFISFTSIGTTRWVDPELLDPESFGAEAHNRPTKQSDCYALGVVIYEVSVHAECRLV